MGAALAGLAILGLTALPITAGMAILRYRLDEIDRIINHTLADGCSPPCSPPSTPAWRWRSGRCSAGSGSGLPVGRWPTPPWPWQPGSSRPGAASSSRRFNRRTYHAAQTIQAFSTRLREQVDLETLSSELLAVVDQTMEPTQASCRLGPPQPAPRTPPPVRPGQRPGPTEHHLSRCLQAAQQQITAATDDS